MYLNYSVACTERIPIYCCKEAKSCLTKKPKKKNNNNDDNNNKNYIKKKKKNDSNKFVTVRNESA